MKKYIWLGLVIVLLGVSGALIWRAQSAVDCGRIDGMSGQRISAEALSKWTSNRDDLILEVHRNELYLQETIGSNAVSLTSPQKLKNNFILTFELMSQTRSAQLTFKTVNDDGSENYVLTLKQNPLKTVAELRYGVKLIKKTEISTLKANKFYEIKLEKKGAHFSVEINGIPVISLTDANKSVGKVVIALQGQPDHPAGITIRNMRLYQ